MSFSKQRMGVAALVAGVDPDAGVGEPSLVEIEDGVDELLGGDEGGAGGLAMEAQGLGGDLADALELALGELDEGANVGGESGVSGDEVEQVGDGFERVVDLVGDGAGEAADGGELLALDEGVLGLLLVGDLEGGGADGLDGAVGVVDGEVVDVPVAMFAGPHGQLALRAGRCGWGGLRGPAGTSLPGRQMGAISVEGAAEDLILGQADDLGLAVVEAEVAEVDGIEEGEADGGGAVDGLDLGALALGLELLLVQGVGGGLAVVDVDGDAEPVDDVAGLVAQGQGAKPEPARLVGGDVDQAGLDVVFGAGGDGVAPARRGRRARSSGWTALSQPAGRGSRRG